MYMSYYEYYMLRLYYIHTVHEELAIELLGCDSTQQTSGPDGSRAKIVRADHG